MCSHCKCLRHRHCQEELARKDVEIFVPIHQIRQNCCTLNFLPTCHVYDSLLTTIYSIFNNSSFQNIHDYAEFSNAVQ